MYNYRYINKLSQFGQVNYSLILEDLDNSENPVVRIEKSFSIHPDLIDNDFLYQEAKKDILRTMQEISEGLPPAAEKDTVTEEIEEGS